MSFRRQKEKDDEGPPPPLISVVLRSIIDRMSVFSTPLLLCGGRGVSASALISQAFGFFFLSSLSSLSYIAVKVRGQSQSMQEFISTQHSLVSPVMCPASSCKRCSVFFLITFVFMQYQQSTRCANNVWAVCIQISLELVKVKLVNTEKEKK